jgi:hypothetical protein
MPLPLQGTPRAWPPRLAPPGSRRLSAVAPVAGPGRGDGRQPPPGDSLPASDRSLPAAGGHASPLPPPPAEDTSGKVQELAAGLSQPRAPAVTLGQVHDTVCGGQQPKPSGGC